MFTYAVFQCYAYPKQNYTNSYARKDANENANIVYLVSDTHNYCFYFEFDSILNLLKRVYTSMEQLKY